MAALFSLKFATLIALFVVLFAVMLAQLFHAFMVAFRRDNPFPALAVVYECLLGASLLLSAIVVRDACNGYGEAALWAYGLLVPMERVCWANALTLLVGIAAMLLLKRPFMFFELIAVALWLPPAASLLGAAWPLTLLAAAALLAFRTAWVLCLDYRHRSLLVTRFTFIEAVNTLPEGVLCADMHGRVMLVNDTMRSLLPRLGQRGLLSDSRSLYEQLQVLGGTGLATEDGHAAEARIEADDGSVWRLRFDELRIARRACWRVMASDITELERLNSDIQAVNESLEQAERELRHAIALVNELAARDAQAKMRARVHDVIGQRLSLLHRCLEDDALSPETLRLLSVLVEEATGELVQRGAPDPASELSFIREAFALIGVEVAVQGELPVERSIAEVFVQVVREATTNAVRHGQARRVDVLMRQSAGSWELLVGNEAGLPAPAAPSGGGTGIPSMRRAVQELGGSLELASGARFEILVRVPHAGSAHASADSTAAHHNGEAS